MTFKHYLLGLAAAVALMVAGPLAQAASFTTGSTGGGAQTNNVQPVLGINHLVALTGTFPYPDRQSGSSPDAVLGEITMFAGNFAPRGFAFA
ncbi:MAG: hypothetical protein ACYTGQ_06145, partial [Planctomycetota bacterium]